MFQFQVPVADQVTCKFDFTQRSKLFISIVLIHVASLFYTYYSYKSIAKLNGCLF